MTENASPLQLLPWSIVTTIIDYTLTSEFQACIVVDLRMQRNPQLDLLSLCRIWRHIVLERLWKKHSLQISTSPKGVFSFSPLVRKDCMPPPNHTGLIKEVEINVPFASILRGEAHSLLTQSKYGSMVLPFARKLYLLLGDGEVDSNLDKAVATAHALGFSKLLKTLIPAAINVRIGFQDTFRHSGEQSQQLLELFLESVYDCSKYSTLHLPGAFVASASTMAYTVNLSFLSLQWSFNTQECAGLIHKCAKSLHKLLINFSHLNHIKSIFFDKAGRAVVYPNMQHLTLRDHTGIVPDELPYIPHAVPFPKLVSLRIFVLHPFADDVLFRGNSDTLTYLSMIPDSVSINVLNRHNVFDAGRYSKLKFVVMNEIINEAVNTAVPAAILSNFLCKMAGPVQVLQMEMCADIKTLFAHPSLGEKGFQTLQILQARSSSLSLFDVLDLLKRLPALDSLYCGLAGLGSELDGIAPENLPEHVVSNYSNVGENLKGWRVSFDRGTNHNTIAVYAMLLALVCPKFTKVDTPLMAMSDYCASISEALRSGTYLKYAPRLSRLLDAVK